MASSMDRRKFLKVLGVSSGGAVAVTGCGPGNPEKLIPYLVPPDNQIPGIATHYASTCRECSAGCGLHVRVREGRPVKVEGNPDSPINRGRLCARGQASLQGLYNPDRIQQPMRRNATGGFDPIPWDEAIAEVVQQLGQAGGDRVWFLSGNETGSLDELVNEWLGAVGGNRVVYEPFAYEALRHANERLFGLNALPQYHFAAAEYVISFGTDFLETFLSPVQFAADFADGHTFHDGHMGRYVHVEPRMSMSGISADEWVAPNPGTEGMIALAMARIVLDEHGDNAPGDAARVRGLLDRVDVDAVAGQTGVSTAVIRRLAAEFAEGASVAVAGGVGAQHSGAATTAAAAQILNYVSGNVGRTVTFGQASNAAGGGSYRALSDLVAGMTGERVGVLFVHGTNPAHNTPPSLGFADAMNQVGFKVSFARFFDETAALADLILPDHDPLEQWNDFQPRVGAYTLLQPVIQPVFDTRQTGDVLLQIAAQSGGALAGRLQDATYKDYLQRQWAGLQGRLGNRDTFDDFWHQSLMAGGVHTAPSARAVRLATTAADMAFDTWEGGDGMALIAYPSSVFFDGRGANRPWLQELPDPVSKMTWSSWIELHPDTAHEMGLHEGDFLEVTANGGTVRAPVFVYPGIKPGVMAMPIGQGHTEFGRYAQDTGANVYNLLSGNVAAFGGISHYAAVQATATGDHERIASNAGRSRQMGRGLAQSTTLHEVEAGHFHPFHPAHAAEVPEHIEHVIEDWQAAQNEEWQRGNYAGEHPRWGMAIDLGKCTGCSACVTACYAENNIPTIGKVGVQRGREMAWIRIERYFEGGTEDQPLSVELLPMMCQQCGRAPCEPVCPVFAAYHTPDGLNGQVYNRCVGTRYCANNCPYKVRYFNWWDHGNPGDQAFSWPEPLHLLLNPDVVVRSKGVMEKCTFCVQRIRGKQHDAAVGRRSLADGEIVTACQQTCPSGAIVFGDLNDPNSRVSQERASELGYRVLEGLNTDPGVTYLTRVRHTVEA